ncbi:ParB/RepB/Spo0J family partition protein [Streptomyces sp. NPDC001205]
MTKSVADQLGRGSSFAKARPVSARRQAVGAVTGAPTEGVIPTEVAVDLISPNPDNPRSEYGDLSELGASLRDHGQKVAVTIMNRDAYIQVNPARKSELEEGTHYVIIDGSSRLFAARDAGVPKLKVMVDDDMGKDADGLLESALVANIHRQSLSEMDEARALERLMAIHGTQTAVAKRLHKSQGWVSQRLALLKLTEDLQALVGTEDIELLRKVGAKPPEEQAESLTRLKEAKEAAKTQKRASKKHAPTPQVQSAGEFPDEAAKPANYYAVIEGEASPGADRHPPAAPGTDAAEVPEPRSAAAPATPQHSGQPDRPTPAVADPEQLNRVQAEAEKVASDLIQRLDRSVLRHVTMLLQRHNRETAEAS